MCGIAGYVGFDREGTALERVEHMLATQVHRGPDDAGVIDFNPREAEFTFLADRRRSTVPFKFGDSNSDLLRVVLGNRRLAIQDPSVAGRQPMITADGRYSIIFNGEIYNHLELRAELESTGYKFRSKSDTEVLLVAFAEWGAECVGRLEGMFAFAVLDTVARRVTLARDPFGIKPLHYAGLDGEFFFSSEIPPLLSLSGVSRRVNRDALYGYLTASVINIADATLFEDIKSIPPAHIVEIDLDNFAKKEPRRYWRARVDDPVDISFAEARTEMRDAFLQSIQYRLRSDVPVGALLSGGTDSSAVVMAMRELGGSNLDIHTFSFIAEHGAQSEEKWIDVVAGAAATISHKLRLRPEELDSDIDGLALSQGEPFGTLAVYAQNRLFRLAGEKGVPVVLSGTGSDESLAGYQSFWPVRLASMMRAGEFRSALGFLMRTRSGADPVRHVARLGKAGLKLLVNSSRKRAPRPLWLNKSWFDERGVKAHELPLSGGPLLARELRHRLEVGIPDLLRFEDRNAMAHSVEGRVPFLTRRMVDLSLSLPESYLIDREGQTKHVFREAMRGIVPDVILDRRDRLGFVVPLASWPSLVPGFAGLLAGAGEIPAVNADVLRPRIERLRTGQGLDRQFVFSAWRLLGLAAWEMAFRPTFE